MNVKTAVALFAFSTPLSAQTVTYFGQECGNALLQIQGPRIGHPFRVAIASMTPAPATIVVGLTRIQVKVGYKFYRDCHLYTWPLWTLSVPQAATTVNDVLVCRQIPNDAGLIGFKFIIQAAAHELDGSSWTQGAECTIGP